MSREGSPIWPPWRLLPLLLAVGLAACSRNTSRPREPGLLFYVSGTNGTNVDFSKVGTRRPNVVRGVTRISDGAIGAGLRCEDTQLLAYRAPGNIYTQRGTLSFFWRARDPVGPTEFPIFRVAFADHSSWDMVWSRIDYNGHGFDAFVTDVNLARTRVSVTLAPFPPPERWIHLALAWDETEGIRFFVDGRLAAAQETRALYDAALDQFGPHSRIISPHNVQSDYSFVRGGDIDEIRIYDRMLNDAEAADLAKGRVLTAQQQLGPRDLREPRWRDEWWWRYGWNRPADPPPVLPGPAVTVRKLPIHDATDLGRWWWKANDGIRETTWPGVYNRSVLPGRHDYFTLPDWDCYSLSGRSVTFRLPDEPWNEIQIEGAAFGKLTLAGDQRESPLFARPRGQEKTFHRLAGPVTGQSIRFDNDQPEQPIAELSVFLVEPGTAPVGRRTLSYRLAPARKVTDDIAPIVFSHVEKRYPRDERALMAATPAPGPAAPPPPRARSSWPGLPLVHVIVAHTSKVAGYAWEKIDDGLDGIVVELPALNVRPTHGALFPLDIQVKDPLWPMRNLVDFSFSVRPGQAETLWLDLPDRILPPGGDLYLTIAGAGGDFGPGALEGAALTLVFKPRDQARVEHERDRFTQVRDAYAMFTEEHPSDPRFNLWNRMKGDLDDLLRVSPEHRLGRLYAAAMSKEGAGLKPGFVQPEPPAGVPLWAFRQVTALEGLSRLVLWYIDHRQIENGELGGGLSDDTDLTNLWPGAALMGCEPDKLAASLRRVLEACYANGMLVRGLPAIQTDELHGYEEGINAIGQNLLLDYGSPSLLERAMETARGVAGLTGVNAAGHRHFRSAYYSATRVAEDSVWGYQKAYMMLLLHPVLLLGDYGGNPEARRLALEVADGLLAHRRPDKSGRKVLPRAIHFASDRESADSRDYFPGSLFWDAWRWTGARKYLDPILDGGLTSILAVNADVFDEIGIRDEWRPKVLAGGDAPPSERRAPGDLRGQRFDSAHRRSTNDHFAWQLTGDKTHLEKLYGDAIEEIADHDYINTEGSIWIDRVAVPTADLQRARLGGVALVRNSFLPGHVVSWRFEAPATFRSVAILVPSATHQAFDVIAYNLETRPVRARMTTWNVDPGRWQVVRGLDTDGDDRPDRGVTRTAADLEPGATLDLLLPPRAATVLQLRLTEAAPPVASRPDLGIERADVTREPAGLRVRVHSLGSVPAPPARVVYRDAAGRLRASVSTPEIPAPRDLVPRTADVVLPLPAGVERGRGTVEIDPDRALREITRRNNAVKL